MAAHPRRLSSLNTKLAKYCEPARKEITTNLSNLSKAVAEEDLNKYGYSLGDYFISPANYRYTLAHLNYWKGDVVNGSTVPTNHLIIIVSTRGMLNTAWLSSGTLSNYSSSTLHSVLTNTVLPNIKSDFNSLFGNWENHLLPHGMCDNAIGGWGKGTVVANTYIQAMSECQVYGSSIFSADGYQQGTSNRQLNVFKKYTPMLVLGNIGYWLKSISTTQMACTIDGSGLGGRFLISNNSSVAGIIMFT